MSDRATGPGWLLGQQPLVCPANGDNAAEPELFYDRQTAEWHVLWRQDAGACESRIHLQRLETSTATLVGPVRQLLAATHPDLGFDENAAASCPGGVQHTIGSPAMVRAGNGQLWLFFSANAPDSGNHATGWAFCGTESPSQGAGCALVNSLDPRSRYRPAWGSSARSAPVAGVNAKPYLGFPDVPGFGGLSVTVGESGAGAGAQPVFATGHLWWGGVARQRTQLVFRLDTTGGLPALFEPGAVTLHGKAGSFGSDALGPVTPSGQLLATRSVPGWGWPAGHQGIFNTITDDGTLLVQGWSETADDFVVAGAYDPKTSEWTTTRATTSLGFDSVTPLAEGGRQLHAGGSAWDVQVLDDGAVAFTNLYVVAAPYFERHRLPVEGVWPSFGILVKRDGRWQVARQWTSAELARSNPDADWDEQACPPYEGLPNGTSACGGPNELAVLPRSRDLIVALYAGDGRRTSGGLMAIRVSKVDGEYVARIVGFYAYPDVPDIAPLDPEKPRNLLIAPKTVETDPTSTLGDERFSMVADAWHADPNDQRKPATGLVPSVTQEFSYNARTGEIRPVSAPFFGGASADGRVLESVHGGIYDYQGNLWTQTPRGVVVYAKTDDGRKLGGTECPFDRARWESRPESYTTTVNGRTVWGQICAPDYEIPQGKDVGRVGLGTFLQLAEDPVSRTIVGIDTWDTGNVFAVRHSGSGLGKSFVVGNVTDTGREWLPRPGRLEQRPPVFDKTGRMWAAFHQWPPAGGVTDGALDHWVVSVDVAQLFSVPAVALGSQTVVQAEQTITTGTRRLPPSANGIARFEALAHVLPCTSACDNDGLPGYGFMLGESDGGGFTGSAEYRVYAPAAGTYRIGYQVRGCAEDANPNPAIELRSGAATYRTSVATGCEWRQVAGPAVQLAAGLNTIRLSAPAGGGNWYLNWFRLTLA